jgi:hypothetical protein
MGKQIEEKSKMNLAISKKSFHYKYYLALCGMWEAGDCLALKNQTERTSLCIYSQFLFWMTVVTLICFPVIFIGWLVLKMGRLLYKICSWTRAGKFVIDGLDKYFKMGRGLELGTEIMLVAPAKYLCAIGGLFIVALAVLFLIAVMCMLGVGPLWNALVTLIVSLPSLLYAAGFYICVGIFYVFWAMGYVFTFTIPTLIIVAKAVATVLLLLALPALIALTTIGVLGGLFALLVKFATDSNSMRDFLGFKINGFVEARKEAADRREKMLEEKRRLRWELRREKDELDELKEKGEVAYTSSEKFAIALGDKCLKIKDWIVHNCFERTVKVKDGITGGVKGGSYKVIGTMSLIWNTLKSIKDGVCPFVEFVDEDDLVEDADMESPK